MKKESKIKVNGAKLKYYQNIKWEKNAMENDLLNNVSLVSRT